MRSTLPGDMPLLPYARPRPGPSVSLDSGGLTWSNDLVDRPRSRAVAQASLARQQTEEAFLDAAERLLVSVGHAGISTRALAEEAGANHGLVHYYFGSMESLLGRVLERFTERMIARQRDGLPMPLDALVSLVITFNEGIIFERLSGIETGQADLLQWIDDWMERKETQ